MLTESVFGTSFGKRNRQTNVDGDCKMSYVTKYIRRPSTDRRPVVPLKEDVLKDSTGKDWEVGSLTLNFHFTY